MTVDPRDVVERLDQRHRAVGHLAERADHLGVAGVADEQDVPAVGDQPLGLAVDLGYQGAGRVDEGQTARWAAAAGTDLGTPCAENTTGRSSGTSSSSSTNTAPESAQPVDDEAIVDDLVADIDRRAVPLERQLDDLDRAVDAGAKPARRGDQHVQRRQAAASVQGGSHGRARSLPCKRSLAGVERRFL